jgi:hypothetical protein
VRAELPAGPAREAVCFRRCTDIWDQRGVAIAEQPRGISPTSLSQNPDMNLSIHPARAIG